METIHVVSHTHWDREWYLTFQQFRLKLVHMIDNLLDILTDDPDFLHFMLDGQTIVLDDYLLIRPEMEEALRRHIKSGRILIGPWHILPDMFLVSPEAHIRNLLEGARTARKFGLKMPIGYSPDPFGQPGQIPQILRGFGIETAALWRGVSDLPAELWWESPDGSRVFLSYLRDSYSNGANLPVHNPTLFAQSVLTARDSLARHSAIGDFLIMLGTDHMEPSPGTSAAIAYADRHLPGTKVIHSSLPAYMKRVLSTVEGLEQQIPTLYGELRACDHSNLLPGVLSSRIWIKQRNHHSQNLLEKWAEPFGVFSQSMIPDDPEKAGDRRTENEARASIRIRNVSPILRQAWRLLMENHPHDSICGCSIDQVHDEMRPRFDQVDQIGEEIVRQELTAISLAVDTRLEGTCASVVIMNPQGSPRRDMVELDLKIPEEIVRFELLTSDGSVIPYEFLGASNQELANVVLNKSNLRDTIGAITEGRVAGAAITRVNVTRDGSTVTVDAILDEKGHPNIVDWHNAEASIAGYEADPGVSAFHVIAHTPRESRVCFVAPEIPEMGWRTIWVRALEAETPAPSRKISPLLKPLLPLVFRLSQSPIGEKLIAALSAGDEGKPPYRIQNENFIVEASASDGTLTITDRKTNIVYTGLNRFVDGGDAGDTYNFSPPAKDACYSPKVVSVKAFRHGLMQSIEIQYALETPAELSPERKSRSRSMVKIPITSRISVFPGGERIDIHTDVENTAKDHRLRVHFPAPIQVGCADYDGHFEVVRRPVGVPVKGERWAEEPQPEVPQRGFTDVTNGETGLMIANRGLPEAEVICPTQGGGTEIAVTLLRCVGWLSRDDMPVRQGHAGPGFQTPCAQMAGRWSFDYSIIPHRGGWKNACQEAYAFETPLRAVCEAVHSGALAAQGSFLSHTPDAFVISAVKEAEDGVGYIVRGYNSTSVEMQVNLKPLRAFSKSTRVNLAEEPLVAFDLGKDSSITFQVSGHEVVSVRFS